MKFSEIVESVSKQFFRKYLPDAKEVGEEVLKKVHDDFTFFAPDEFPANVQDHMKVYFKHEPLFIKWLKGNITDGSGWNTFYYDIIKPFLEEHHKEFLKDALIDSFFSDDEGLLDNVPRNMHSIVLQKLADLTIK